MGGLPAGRPSQLERALRGTAPRASSLIAAAISLQFRANHAPLTGMSATQRVALGPWTGPHRKTMHMLRGSQLISIPEESSSNAPSPQDLGEWDELDCEEHDLYLIKTNGTIHLAHAVVERLPSVRAAYRAAEEQGQTRVAIAVTVYKPSKHSAGWKRVKTGVQPLTNVRGDFDPAFLIITPAANGSGKPSLRLGSSGERGVRGGLPLNFLKDRYLKQLKVQAWNGPQQAHEQGGEEEPHVPKLLFELYVIKEVKKGEEDGLPPQQPQQQQRRRSRMWHQGGVGGGGSQRHGLGISVSSPRSLSPRGTGASPGPAPQQPSVPGGTAGGPGHAGETSRANVLHKVGQAASPPELACFCIYLLSCIVVLR